MKHNGTTAGFTLIELMIVVIIIAALAGMVIPRLMPASKSAQSKIARGDIANIEIALDLYRLHVGKYPSTTEGLSILLQKPSSGDWDEPFLDKISDPWKQNYEYAYPGTHNTSKFDVWSKGPDPANADDDITNWGTSETK